MYINSVRFGGAERVMSNLATQLSEIGYEVILITSFAAENEYICGEKVQRVILDNNRIGNFLKRNIVYVKKLRSILKKERPDVLISFMAEPNYRALIASVGLKNKVLISIRNDPNKEYPDIVQRFLAKHLFRRADGVVFQTDDAKTWFPKAIQEKSMVIFNQVDPVFYDTKYEGHRHDIVTTGNFKSQKNHKLLIKAFASIADKISENLIIYGEGTLRAELEDLIQKLNMNDRIFLPGAVSNVPDTIKSAKLFVLSSDFEGMPNALMEAMALGIPCISTDCPCGGPKMLFGKDLKDNLVPCGDEEGLARKMEYMLKQSSNGKTERRLAENFQPNRIFKQWIYYIESICKKG